MNCSLSEGEIGLFKLFNNLDRLLSIFLGGGIGLIKNTGEVQDYSKYGVDSVEENKVTMQKSEQAKHKDRKNGSSL